MLIIPPVDACVAEVDSFVSQRIPESDGEFSPLIRKKGWKKRRMTTKEPAGIYTYIFYFLVMFFLF